MVIIEHMDYKSIDNYSNNNKNSDIIWPGLMENV
jgi:hypothetical protein